MLELILIRHGQTEYNAERRVMGHSDISLNAKGQRESKSLDAKLKDDQIDLVYSSDLLRCRETLQAAGQGLYEKAVFTESLREMNFGIWEGLLYHEIKTGYPDLFSKYSKNRLGYVVPEGESYQLMSERVIKLIDEICQNESGKVLIVTHHGCASSIIGHFIFGAATNCFNFIIENSRVSRLVFKDDGSVYLKSLNE